ncbi:MAG: dephospho-CoA kinase [Anaerolineaceae bacterium]|nr:dephospho-CoA kinase [Anaerolineaceae bacterium]
MMTSAKRIIGLTGNIATGKSVVRQMLVNHGALGIDADIIAHRVLYPGGSAYQQVVNAFGAQILTQDGEIARNKLAEIVFSSPGHLHHLESITHPAITNAIRQRIEAATLPMIVIEAIKLMESSLATLFDSLWVSHVAREEQLSRLINIRKMDAEDARQRIDAQPPQSEKLSLTDVVIHTDGTFENTWRQIHTALNDTIQINTALETLYLNIIDNWWIHPAGCFPSSQLSAFINEHLKEPYGELAQWLAFKIVTPIVEDQTLRQLVVWESRNFTGKINRIIPAAPAPDQAEIALLAFEAHARANQCELLIVPDAIAATLAITLSQQGYSQPQNSDISYPDWQQAVASEKAPWIKRIGKPFESTSKHFFTIELT